MTRLRAALAEAAEAAAPSPAMALMRVLIEAPDEAAARAELAAAIAACDVTDPAGADRLRRIAVLWQAQPGAWATVRGIIGAIDHERHDATPDATLRYWASAFDRMAKTSPEGSVALYSLGDPTLLAAATAEVVDWMGAQGLLAPDRDVLDLGCGIGRFLAALSPLVRSVTGLDLSETMVAEARRRCRDLANVSVALTTGHDLRGIPSDSMDLVLAADVFPYLVQAGGGLPARHIAEFARVLRPGGRALVLNYSYRGDPARDRDDLLALATGILTVEQAGTPAFRLWDGRAYLLRKP